MKSTKFLFLALLVLSVASVSFYFNYRVTPLKLAKKSKEELLQYMKSFPLDEYEIYSVPSLEGHFYVDSIPDVIKKELRRGVYVEQEIGDLIAHYAKKGTIALDLGAHIGVHTLRMSRAVGDSGQVICFEPQKKLFRELVLNMCLNECKNVLLLRNAIGKERQPVQMSFRQESDEGSVSIGYGGDDAEMIALDELHLEDVSLIKIDAKYYEDKILHGARKTLLRNKPAIILEIMGGYDYTNCPEEIQKRFDQTLIYLSHLGYKSKVISGNNYLAVPLEESYP